MGLLEKGFAGEIMQGRPPLHFCNTDTYYYCQVGSISRSSCTFIRTSAHAHYEGFKTHSSLLHIMLSPPLDSIRNGSLLIEAPLFSIQLYDPQYVHLKHKIRNSHLPCIMLYLFRIDLRRMTVYIVINRQNSQ